MDTFGDQTTDSIKSWTWNWIGFAYPALGRAWRCLLIQGVQIAKAGISETMHQIIRWLKNIGMPYRFTLSFVLFWGQCLGDHQPKHKVWGAGKVELTLAFCGLGCSFFLVTCMTYSARAPWVGLVSLVCSCWTTWWQSISTWLGTLLGTVKSWNTSWCHYHLQLAIHGNADLDRLLQKVSVAGESVLPHVLLSKKTETHQARSK